MNKIKAILISINDEFKVVAEKIFDAGTFPSNNFASIVTKDGKAPYDHQYESSWNFNYL